MTWQRLAAVLVSLYITSLTRRVSCCTGLVLTSSFSGRNACPSEEVTLTCTAQGDALFWRNEAFGEKTMHYTSASSTGELTAKIVSYDRNQNCLVSSLSFRATDLRNGTTVTCISRDRSSSQSLSLHIIDVALENFTVIPEPNSSVLLEWKVTPTDGHHCIRNYNIQIVGPNGSQWEEQIPGSSQSFCLTGLQLIPLQEYTYCVSANLFHGGQIGLKLTVNFTELQEPHPPTNLSAVVQCKQGYEIQIDWQPPLLDSLAAPLTGYLLKYHDYDNTSTIELPALNTSYTLDSVPSGVVYTITVSALSDVGPSKNNPSIQFTTPSLTCTDTLVTPEGSRMKVYFMRAMTDVESTDLDSDTCVVDVVPSHPCNCTNLVEQTNMTDSRNQSCAGLSENSTSMDTITLCSITALTSGVLAFSCGFLFATLCKRSIIRRKNLLDRHNVNTVSKHLDTVSQKREQSPQYETIPLRKPPLKNNGVELQQNIAYDFHKPAQSQVTINS